VAAFFVEDPQAPMTIRTAVIHGRADLIPESRFDGAFLTARGIFKIASRRSL
jgi:hypothetical protein